MPQHTYQPAITALKDPSHWRSTHRRGHHYLAHSITPSSQSDTPWAHLPCQLAYFCGNKGALISPVLHQTRSLNTYSLVRICRGDEWNTTFSTFSGLYEYCIMPYGLSSTPSVFQCLVNDVLRDMLGKFVTAYIDDILIYSPSYETHIHHVCKVLQKLLQ